ncbi:unnamed protein product [Pleuronectes platessa]|uniref:Uncharacterized protein n=1 Tax=Pleuronectes platessa TaxID=8262 RepID=A0A9N7YC74_PLEPL|nr:unnamed protein product [Pleuronectes platessa]
MCGNLTAVPYSREEPWSQGAREAGREAGRQGGRQGGREAGREAGILVQAQKRGTAPIYRQRLLRLQLCALRAQSGAPPPARCTGIWISLRKASVSPNLTSKHRGAPDWEKRENREREIAFALWRGGDLSLSLWGCVAAAAPVPRASP